MHRLALNKLSQQDARWPNNSLNLTEALARWLRRAQAAAPRINVQWTRGCAAELIGHSAAG